MKRFLGFVAVHVAMLGVLSAQPQPARPRETPPPGPGMQPAGAGLPQPAGPGPERGWRREGGQQGMPSAFMERLRQENPEAHERLSRVYKNDRQQFFQEVRKLMAEGGLPVPEAEGARGRVHRESPEEQKCAELSRLFQEAQNEAEKQRIRAELTAAIQAAFEARLHASKERIARLEEQLKDFRQHLDRLEGNRDRVCEERLEELTKPPELRWDGNW
jgi:hypothetical protein